MLFHNATKASISYVSVHALRVTNLWNTYWILNTLLLLKSRQPLHVSSLKVLPLAVLTSVPWTQWELSISFTYKFRFMQSPWQKCFHTVTMPRSLSLEAGLFYHLTAMVTMVTVVSCQIFLQWRLCFQFAEEAFCVVKHCPFLACHKGVRNLIPFHRRVLEGCSSAEATAPSMI